MRGHALLVVEARGQGILLCEDACLNLIQARLVAEQLARRGVVSHVRLIVDAGESIEEYSVLCHLEDAVHERIRREIRLAPDRRQARRAAVDELRERFLPYRLDADAERAGCALADELFFAGFAARVGEENPLAIAALETGRDEAIDRAQLEPWRALVAEHRGRPALEFEEAVARRALAGVDGAIASIEVLCRAAADPVEWLGGAAFAALLEDEIDERERHGGRDLGGRLLGVFPPVAEPLSGRDYFNSPTSVRCEHGRLRIGARDRFSLLGFEGTERLSFAELRDRLARQRAGGSVRPFAVKYPLAARRIAEEAGTAAAQLAAEAPTVVIFLEGVVGRINPATGGLVDRLLASQVPADAPYFRFAASAELRALLPRLAGGLPLVERFVAARIEAAFVPAFDVEAIVASLAGGTARAAAGPRTLEVSPPP